MSEMQLERAPQRDARGLQLAEPQLQFWLPARTSRRTLLLQGRVRDGRELVERVVIRVGDGPWRPVPLGRWVMGEAHFAVRVVLPNAGTNLVALRAVDLFDNVCAESWRGVERR